MSKPSESKETTLRELIEPYTRRWYWFVITAIIGVTLAFIYLRYTTAYYQTQATVIIKDEKSGGGGVELAAFSDLGGVFSKFGNSKIENELAIFESKRIISEAVKELNLNVTYESVGTIKTTEIYRNKPFIVNYLSVGDSLQKSPGVPKLFVEIISNDRYQLYTESGSIDGTYTFGEKIELPFGAITVVPALDTPTVFERAIEKTFAVTYRPINSIAGQYQRLVNISNNIKNSNVVTLSIQSPVREKAEDFINELVFQYNKDAIYDRNQVAQKTSNFIDSRLEIITRELDSVERNKEEFKSSNRLTNIESEAQLILENASEFNNRQLDVSTQLELSNTMIDYMENSSSNDLLPSNIGLDGDNISQSVINYNQLILQRNRLLKNSTDKNPVVVNINHQIEQIRSTILSSLKNTNDQLKVSLRGLNYQESALNSRISEVPAKEKIFRGIERQQTIKEQLYLFLLQQREEASIKLAVTAPKAKVVDLAASSRTPVSPNRSLVLLGAILAGVLLPGVLIYGSQLLDTKIRNRRDLEKLMPSTSILGEIPKLKKSDNQLVQLNDRSVLGESFRILRTNLQYLFVGKEVKKIFVTSTVKGEGKTFVAFNLALTIALTGKKVVLVGADIRNPQLHRYLNNNQKDEKGLTEFIIDRDLSIEALTHESSMNKNLSIILSGAIPPNPAELLLQDRTSQFFNELEKKFDYVIVDTAPSMLVTDTILLNPLADIMLYVARAGYTDKRLIEFPKDAVEDGRLSHLNFVLNNVDLNHFGYGNKYGYAYTEDVGNDSFLKRMFRK